VKKLLIAAVIASAPLVTSVAHADPTNPTPFPCDSRDVHVSKIDPQTGNAIEVWGPPGCDDMLPMTGNN
jgi:hypothetical protein